MFIKKIISLSTAFVILSSLMFSSTVLGANISQEKIMLMQAAGEIPVQGSANDKVTKITRENAVVIAKTILEDASLYETSNIALNPNYSPNGRMWSINFFKKSSPGGNVSVGIDSDSGEILNFNIWEGNNGQQNFIAKLTRNEARVKADNYLKSQLKEDLNSFELQKDDPNYYNSYYGGVKQQVTYNYVYIRKLNNIPFTNNNINIGVDGTSGKIISFYKSSITVKAPKIPVTKDIISVESALSKYKESANVILQYISTNERRPYGMSAPKIKLAYVPMTYISMIDAITGKQVNYDGSLLNSNAAAYEKLMENPIPMLPNGKLESKSITESEAIKKSEVYKNLMEGILNVKFDQNNNSFSVSYPNTQDNVWNYNWNKNNGNSNINFNLGINGDTGRIASMNFGNYDSRMSSEEQKAVNEKYSWEKAKEKALDVIKKVLPQQYGFFVDENIKKPELSSDALKYLKEYNYTFTRVVNGLRFRDNSMNISIDRETGEIRNFYFNWNDLDFPEVAGVISRETAAKAYFTGIDAKLSYFVQTTYNRTGAPIVGDTPQLVYTFSNSSYPMNYGSNMDAMTGKFLDYSGAELKLQSSTDELKLAESWAKRSVELLSSQGILKKDTVDYAAGVSRYEAIKMLSLSKGFSNYDPSIVITPTFKDVAKTDDFFLYVENAVKQKIIMDISGEFKGKEIITKSEYSKLLINMIGFSDIAKYKDIFKLDGSTNVPGELTGYVAICKALDILPIKDGEAFDGSKPVTYAEAAVSLYKALAFIK